jgi:hypothetical protein
MAARHKSVETKYYEDRDRVLKGLRNCDRRTSLSSRRRLWELRWLRASWCRIPFSWSSSRMRQLTKIGAAPVRRAALPSASIQYGSINLRHPFSVTVTTHAHRIIRPLSHAASELPLPATRRKGAGRARPIALLPAVAAAIAAASASIIAAEARFARLGLVDLDVPALELGIVELRYGLGSFV